MTNNPYLGLVQQDLQQVSEPPEPKTPVNPYEEQVQKDASLIKTKLAQSIQATQDSAPDEVAALNDVSKQTGIPWSIARDNRSEIENRLSKQKISAEVSVLPVNVQDWLSEDNNIGIARDDLPRLKSLVDAVQNKAWYEQTTSEKYFLNPMKTAIVNLRQAGAVGLATPALSRSGLYDEMDSLLASGGQEAAMQFVRERDAQFAGTALKSDLLRYIGANEEDRQEIRQDITETIGGAAQSVAKAEQDRQKIPRDPNLDKALQEDTASAVLREVIKDPGIAARVGVESLIISAPSLAAGLFAGPAGMAAGSFGTERGLKVLEVLREAGIDTSDPEMLIQGFTNPQMMEEATKRAELKALGVSAFDLVGAGIARRMLSPTRIGGKTLSNSQREIINVFAQVPAQGLQEAAGEAAGQFLADGKVSTAEVMLEAIGGGFGSTAEVATFSGGRVMKAFTDRADQYRRSQKDKGYLTEIKDAVNQTKLKDRDPSALQALMNRVAEGGPVQEMYIDGTQFRELFQSANLDPQEFAQKMESVGEQYFESMLLGGDIRISLADFARYIAPTEIADQFILQARTDTTGMSPSEADAWMSQEARPMLDAIVNFDEDQAGASGEAVFNDVVGQLTASGMDRVTAERNATLYRALFSVLGEQEGMDAKELYDSYNLKISRPMPDVLGRADNGIDSLDPLLDRIRTGDFPKQFDVFGMSLSDFLRDKGGIIDEGGELSARDVDVDRKAFTKKLIQTEGRTLDDAAELAAEAGYIKERDINALIDAIDRESRGNPVYAAGSENAQLQQLGADLAVIQGEMDRLGLDVSGMSNADIKEELSKVAYKDSDIAAEVELNQGSTQGKVSSMGELRELLERNGELFVRWSSDSKYDLAEGAVSRDYATGDSHGGLSAVPISSDMSDSQILKRVSEYGFLRMKDGAIKPFIYSGAQTGVDSDGYASIRPTRLVASLDDGFIARLDKDLARIVELQETLDDALSRLPKTEGFGREIVQKRIDDTRSELLILLPGTDIKPAGQIEDLFQSDTNQNGNPEPDALSSQEMQVDEITDNAEIRRILEAYSNQRGQGQRQQVPDRTVGGGQADQSWRDATSIRGSDGKPAPIYRGAGRKLTAEDFKPGALGAATKNPSAPLGVWFTSSKQDASRYGKVDEYFADIRNPRIFSSAEVPEFNTPPEATAMREKLQAEGFDGIVFDYSDVEGPIHVVAFNAEQAIDPGTVELFQSLPDTIEVDGTQRPTTNSNGKRIAQTEEGIRNFWRWFGGGITDEQGRPKVLYHGTKSDFDTFKVTGLKRTSAGGQSGKGRISLTTDPVVANRYAQEIAQGNGLPKYVGHEELIEYFKSVGLPHMAQHAAERYMPGNKVQMQMYRGMDPSGGNVVPVLVRGKVKTVDASKAIPLGNTGFAWFTKQENAAKKEGYDAVVFDGMPERWFPDDIGKVTVFDGANIKSAIGNSGTFDPESPNILEQRTTDDKRGVIRIDRTNRQFNIELLEKADLSTFLHESGHFFLEVMGDLASREGATDGLKADYQAVLDWFNVESKEKIGVDQHEQFARGFESYLMEGRAPSPELQSVFSRFRAWLLSIYKRLSALNVELTDDVRGVFDRLLATDEQIEASREGASMDKLLGAIEALGWNSKEKEQYADLVRQSREDAKAELIKSQMADHKKIEQEWYKSETEAVRREVMDEIGRNPTYVALAHLQRGKLPDGSPLPEGIDAAKLSKQALVDAYGEAFLKRLPGPQNPNHKGSYIYSREGGIDPDALAPLYGFSSGDEMIMAMANARPMNDVIKAEVETRMAERYPNINLSGESADIAIRAVHNDKQAELLLLEMKKLHGRSSGKGRPVTPAQVMRQSAQAMIRNSLVRDLRPDLFRRAEAKAGKAAFEAATKGNYDEAYRQKQNQIMNHYLYREAVKAREAAEKIVDYVQKFSKKTTREKIGKAGGSYLEQIDAIVDQYEFRRVSVKQLNRRDSLRTWMDRQNDEGNPIDLPDYVLDQAERKNYRELSVEELEAVQEAIKNIEHVATVKNRLLNDRLKREVGQAREDIANSINQNSNRKVKQAIESHLPAENTRFFIADYLASHRRLSSIIREMDGGQDMGTTWDLIMRPINAAGDMEADMTAKSNEKLGELFKLYKPGELRRFLNKKYIEEIDASLTKQGIIMVALNTGTEDNLQKLKDGYGWSDFQIQSILKNLEQKDWDFIQGIWDHINSYWPLVEAKEKRVKGVSPAKVEAMQVMTPYGMYRGGYFPLKYDERQEVGAYGDRIKEMADMAMRGAFSASTTRRGHTKERVKGVQRKIKLDFGVVFQHLTEVIHDLSHHEMLMDVNRLLKGEAVKDAIVENYGMPIYQIIDKAIVDIAAGDVPAIHAHEKALQHLRNGVTIAGLGWNVSTAMLQPLGLTNSIVRVGPKWIWQGVKRWMTSASAMEGTAKWITEVSPFMRNRFTTQSREINDIRNKLRGKGRLSMVEDSYFWMITRMQMVADIPTWLGSYEKAKADGISEADAYAVADQAVIDAQGGGQIKDLAQIQRGHPALKLFTNFISYFVTTWNLLASSYRGKDFTQPKDIGRFAVDFLLLYTIPAVMGFAIKGALKGFDDDDMDDLGKTLAAEQVSFFLAGFFGLREFGSAVSGFMGYSGPAGTRFFNEGSRVIVQAQQGELDAGVLKPLNNTLGILFHYPAGQVQRTVSGAAAMFEGETSNPTALLLGPPKD